MKKIPQEGLNNPSLQSYPITNMDTIPGGVYEIRGPSGKTLIRPYMVEVVVPEVMSMLNATNKVGT